MGTPMSSLRKAVVLLVSLACALAMPLAVSTPAAAATVTYTLFAGRGPGSPAGTGWSFNNTTLSSPGPDLSATVGDTVILTLNATDGRTHSWYIDYNNNSAFNPGAPANESGIDFPDANGTAVTWGFVPTQNGTFYYRSRSGGDGQLWGRIIIAPAGGGAIPGVDNTVLIVVGAVLIIVAVLAILSILWRRMRAPPPPPKS